MIFVLPESGCEHQSIGTLPGQASCSPPMLGPMPSQKRHHRPDQVQLRGVTMLAHPTETERCGTTDATGPPSISRDPHLDTEASDSRRRHGRQLRHNTALADVRAMFRSGAGW